MCTEGLRIHYSPTLPTQMYTEGLLVQMAPPDISMPYNVVCLTCTVLAVFFGAMLNSLIKVRRGQSARGGRCAYSWDSPRVVYEEGTG